MGKPEVAQKEPVESTGNQEQPHRYAATPEQRHGEIKRYVCMTQPAEYQQLSEAVRELGMFPSAITVPIGD